MLNELNSLRLTVADFLSIKILEKGFISINLWHAIHFFSGAIVMFFIIVFFKRKSYERKLILLGAALVFYELVEMTFILNGSGLFIGETGFDIFMDLALGFLGGFLFLGFSLRKK